MRVWAIILLLWVAPALLLSVVLVRASLQKRSARDIAKRRLPPVAPKSQRRAPAE
ncbi:MAG TPA: hypothetical protein VHE36_14030 [Sphingomicrobium sp.]|jgi:hypothetical protein|nr:hypothetical protein [Sphingomicrobium sp.]